jgi:hypothetical protein
MPTVPTNPEPGPGTQVTLAAIAADPLLDDHHRRLLGDVYAMFIDVSADRVANLQPGDHRSEEAKTNASESALVTQAEAPTGEELEAQIRAALARACPEQGAGEYAVYDQFGFLVKWLSHVNQGCGTTFVDFIARTTGEVTP